MKTETRILDEERFEAFLKEQDIKFRKTDTKYILEKPIRVAIDEVTERPLKIAFAGKAGCGKSTVTKALVKDYGFTAFSFANKLKEICRSLFPEKMKKTKEQYRHILQEFGDATRKIHQDVWIEIILRQIENSRMPRIVIDDMRFKNEFLLLRDYGFKLIYINRPSWMRAEHGYNVTDKHKSETDLDNWLNRFDMMLYNGYKYPFKEAVIYVLDLLRIPH